MKCSCGADNPDNARFCNQCASALTAAIPRRDLPREAERRQLTVMFTDLVSSTAIARALDGEDYRDLLNEYQAICSETVNALEGHVAQYLGDGVLVYFGYPQAHEDDPRRAIQAALDILERTRSLNEQLSFELPFVPQVRVGIHTGVVVVGQVGDGREHLAVGEAPNLAARLQQTAAPGAVVITEATRQLVDGYFVTESCGVSQFKGFDEPVHVHRVLGATHAPYRGAAAAARLSPIVGREKEMVDLDQQWEMVLDNRACRAVVISGEPGIGKSRQAHAFKERLEGSCRVLEGYCSPLHQNAAFHPIAQAFESCLGLGGVNDPQAKFLRIERYREELALDPDDAAFLASVLSIPVPDAEAPAMLTPAVKRQRTMLSLMAWSRALSRQAPVLFLIEDLQWADPSTLELLGAQIGTSDGAPILLLTTCRPEFVPPWPSSSSASIVLDKLPRDLGEQLIQRVAHDRILPPALIDRVLELSDGVPLYVEEVTKAILESDALQLDGNQYQLAGALPEAVVPPTIHDSLMARLDRTGQSKAVAQLAATLGREFSYDLLCTVALMDTASLNAGLRGLTEAGLILTNEKSGATLYRFKHALIQETAYQSLIKNRRQQYHHRVASVLRDQYPEVAEAQPHLIALHHAGAGLPELAARYFENAGNLAFGAQAYAESISHFRSSLEQLHKLPHSKGRDRSELNTLSALGLPLLMTRGYATPDVETLYERALALSAEVTPSLRVLFGIWAVQMVRGDRASTERMAAEFEQIAHGSSNASERLISLAAVGSRAFWMGELDKAISALREAVAAFQPEMLVTLPRDFGYDNPLYGHLYLAWAEHTAGRFTDGQATWNALWRITQNANAPYLTVMALFFGAVIARDTGDSERALELSRSCMALAHEHQLMFWLALAQVVHGWAQCACQLPKGIELIEQGVQLFRAIGARTSLPAALGNLAEAYLQSGSTDLGLAVLEEGLELCAKNLDRTSIGELYRLKGELLLQKQAPTPQVETCFRESLELSRTTGAALPELRCAMSYARWLAKRGHARDGKQMLDLACARMTGEPPLLQQARRLANELVSFGESPKQEARG